MKFVLFRGVFGGNESIVLSKKHKQNYSPTKKFNSSHHFPLAHDDEEHNS